MDAALRPTDSSDTWARSAGGGGAAGGVAVFPGSCPESSEEQDEGQDVVESMLEEKLAFLVCGCPSRRSANAAPQRKPADSATGIATAAVELRGGGAFKRSGRLLDEAVGAIEGADGAAGAAPKPVGSSNIWARSEGSGGGATGGAVGTVDGAARVGGGAGVAGSGGWTRPGRAVVEVGAGGRHGAEQAGAQA